MHQHPAMLNARTIPLTPEGYAPVGTTVLCGYWRERYTVLSHNSTGSITVQWHGTNAEPPRKGTHFTSFDRRRDTVLTPQS